MAFLSTSATKAHSGNGASESTVSMVKLIVQFKGSDDRKIYELERKTLEVPENEAPNGGGSLPPTID